MSYFLSSEIEQGSPNSALFHVIPVPFERSVSYGGGTSMGPEAIIRASNQLETFDQLGNVPCDAGIYTHATVDCRGEVGDVLERIRKSTKMVAEKGNIPFVLGGEHTVSYGAIMGVVDAFPNEKIGVIQFDAHADLRESYEGSVWSHACVMKRVLDEGLPIMQIGVRAISNEELAIRTQFPSQIGFYDAREICGENPKFELVLPENFPKHVYITVDIDGLDSAVMPATGTPVPGGLSFWQLISLLRSALRDRVVLGMDLVEYAPIPILHSCDYTAADLAYKMMGLVYQSRQ